MILVSRLQCGCMASALLSDDDEESIKDFAYEELKLGRTVLYEDRTEVWAEKCEDHERKVK